MTQNSDKTLRLPTARDPLTPAELADLSRQMAADLDKRGVRDREMLACEMENMHRLCRTAGHLLNAIKSACVALDDYKFQGARDILDRAMKGTDLPERVRIDGIDHLKQTICPGCQRPHERLETTLCESCDQTIRRMAHYGGH